MNKEEKAAEKWALDNTDICARSIPEARCASEAAFLAGVKWQKRQYKKTGADECHKSFLEWQIAADRVNKERREATK